MTKVHYQTHVITTLASGCDDYTNIPWIYWIDVDDQVWHTVNGENRLITGEERQRILHRYGYPHRFNPFNPPQD